MSIQRHAAYNFVGTMFSFGISLVTVPLYLDIIGEARFGVLAIVWILFGYFGLFDIGMSRTAAHKIARLSSSPVSESQQVFWTTLELNVILGVIGGCLLYLFGHKFFGVTLKMGLTIQQEFLSSLNWIALAVPVVTVNAALIGTLQAREAFLLLNILQVLGNVFLQVAPLGIAYYIDADLNKLITAVVLTKSFSTIILFVAALKILPGCAPRLPSFRVLHSLFSYGIWVSISSLIVPLFGSLDKFMIASIMGAPAVTYYAIPERLSRRISIIPSAISGALFPRMSMLYKESGCRMAASSLKIIQALLTPIVVLMILLMRPFLSFWINAKFAEVSTPIGIILALSVWFNGLAYIPYSYLQAVGRPELTARFHMIEILPYVALLWFGLSHLGLIGGAAATLFISVLDAILLLWGSDLNPWRLSSFWLGICWLTASIGACLLTYGNVLLELIMAATMFLCCSFFSLRAEAELRSRIFVVTTSLFALKKV